MKNTHEETKRRAALGLHAHNRTNREAPTLKSAFIETAIMLAATAVVIAIWNLFSN